MAFLGLLFILAGWFLQYRSTSEKPEKGFLGLYAIGTLLMVLDNLTNATLLIAFLNLMIFIIVLLVMFRNPTRKRRRR